MALRASIYDYPLVIETFEAGYFSRGLHAEVFFVQAVARKHKIAVATCCVQYGYGKMCGHGRKKTLKIFEPPGQTWPAGKFPITFVVLL